MIQAKLPDFFKPKTISPSLMIRLGDKNDGGYLTSISDVKESEVLLSYGISTDWKFEKAFLRINKIPIFAYDASTNGLLFIRQFLGRILRRESPLLAITNLFKYFEYKIFFTGTTHHVKHFIGLGKSPTFIPISKTLTPHRNKKCFIKMDIEGAEYRCLDEIIKFQDQLTGIVLELHNVDLHIEKISNFIKKLDLNLIHVHANNYGEVTNEGIPESLELSFSRHSSILHQEEAPVPHPLDSPCNPNLQEIIITFE